MAPLAQTLSATGDGFASPDSSETAAPRTIRLAKPEEGDSTGENWAVAKASVIILGIVALIGTVLG